MSRDVGDVGVDDLWRLMVDNRLSASVDRREEKKSDLMRLIDGWSREDELLWLPVVAVDAGLDCRMRTEEGSRGSEVNCTTALTGCMAKRF